MKSQNSIKESDEGGNQLENLMFQSVKEMEEFVKDIEVEKEFLDDSIDEITDSEYVDESYSMEENEDDFDIKDALRMASNFKNPKPKKNISLSYWKRKLLKSMNRELDPLVRQNLSQANEAFVKNDYQNAIRLYLEVIKVDPKNFSAYKTIGEIYKQQDKLNECCNYWFLAATIHQWDFEFWGEVGELSNRLGHIDQAIYCYTKAISNDIDRSKKYIYERSLLYKEKKQYGRALEGIQKLRRTYTTDSNLIKVLTSIYIDKKRINDAIILYVEILEANLQLNDEKEKTFPKFGWAELNILLELYIQQHSWKIGIRMVKVVSRWIQSRQDEEWWDNVDDDSEFDRIRRNEKIVSLGYEEDNILFAKTFDLPIDIRFKMGVFRLEINQKTEALNHFSFLLTGNDEIADLFFETGKALEKHGFHADALTYLSRALKSDEFHDNIELISLIGKCSFETCDYHQAKKIYLALLKNDPKNLENKLLLAETLYYLGESSSSQNLLLEVQFQKENKSSEIKVSETSKDIVKSNQNSLIITEKSNKSFKAAKLTNQDKLDFENNAKKIVVDKFRRIQRLSSSIEKNDENAIRNWMQLSSQLIEIFMSMKFFFPKDKSRTFKGLNIYKKNFQMNVDEKLARIYSLHQFNINEEFEIKNFDPNLKNFRGISFDDWFYIFIQYAIFLVNFEKNISNAIEIIDVTMSVNIFFQDKKKISIMKIIRIVLGILENNYDSVFSFSIRHFLVENQFSPFFLKFFLLCFSSGIDAWESFSNYNHQKFFLRQLKAFDSMLSNKKITGMASITTNIKNISNLREHPDLLYIYANLLGGSRSYTSSIVYLHRAYKVFNNDPMICLLLALAHVHRSMQRISTNRHIQLLQGISYLLKYKELRGKNATFFELQEINYNFGRFFHMLGLFSSAVYYYNKVLDCYIHSDHIFNLQIESSYNLSIIYNIVGNNCLSKEIITKYLTV